MIKNAAKTIARRFPPIDRLIRQRDELLARQDDLLRKVEQLRQEPRDQSETPPPCDRRELVLRHLNLEGLGLEIGPSYNPLVPKSQGYHVETIDHADAANLREKYRHLDVSPIEEVDYISDGGSIFETIGKPGRYEYIIASHVIEHVPDLLGFFNDCRGPEGGNHVRYANRSIHCGLRDWLSVRSGEAKQICR